MSSETLVSTTALTGGCQCGAVTYSSTHCPSKLTSCHCPTCRKLSGAPFLTFGDFPVSSITWTNGTSSLKQKSYSDLATRTHCGECGSPISMQYRCDPEVIGLTAGTIDEKSVKGRMPKIETHMFTAKGEKAEWYDLPEDKVPKYQTFECGFQKKLNAWKKVLTAPGLG